MIHVFFFLKKAFRRENINIISTFMKTILTVKIVYSDDHLVKHVVYIEISRVQSCTFSIPCIIHRDIKCTVMYIYYGKYTQVEYKLPLSIILVKT